MNKKIYLSIIILFFSFLNVANAQVNLPKTKQNIEQNIIVYLTGYSFWDNTPLNSAIISHPVIHKIAGGIGSYNDPITLAVGHSIINGEDILDFSAGTRFYIPALKKYAIVEDSCGDGDRPQDIACHVGYHGKPWLDIYVDGKGLAKSVSDKCSENLTDLQMVVMTPKPNYLVVLGSLSEAGCEIF